MRNSKGQFMKGHRQFEGSKKGWFKKGHVASMKGKHHSVITKLKISFAIKGKRSGINIACKRCKNIFYVYTYRKDEALFCSKQCYFLSRKKKIKIKKNRTAWNKGLTAKEDNRISAGDKSPHWRGGVTSRDVYQRKKFRKLMQKQIFERDNYTCQMCGSKKDLQVDHIQSWAEYVELRFNMDNCRTLCAKCHYQITYGKPMPEELKAWGHNLMKGELP